MKDLIREFRMVAKRREESDSESQPLLSSQSSSSSFGATRNVGMFPEYDTTDCEECERIVSQVNISPSSPSQILPRRSLCFPRGSVYDTPALDVYTAEEEIYDRWPYFTKVTGVLARRASSMLQKSFSESGYQAIDGTKTQSSIVTMTDASGLAALTYWNINRWF